MENGNNLYQNNTLKIYSKSHRDTTAYRKDKGFFFLLPSEYLWIKDIQKHSVLGKKWLIQIISLLYIHGEMWYFCAVRDDFLTLPSFVLPLPLLRAPASISASTIFTFVPALSLCYFSIIASKCFPWDFVLCRDLCIHSCPYRFTMFRS